VPVRMSMKNGVVTADVTNTEITSSNFTLSIDFYHNTTELVDWEVELPPLDPGKSTSISYFAPSGANRYKLDGVDKNFDSCIEALCRGGPDVEYNVTYVPATE
jgi:hypothetical protein